MAKAPDIKPIKLEEYNVRQSKYSMAGRIPIGQIVLGPSGCGKGIYIQNEILDIYKNMFSRIYIFSPSTLSGGPVGGVCGKRDRTKTYRRRAYIFWGI